MTPDDRCLLARQILYSAIRQLQTQADIDRTGATPLLAGYDLCADEAAVIPPGESRLIKTGLILAIDPGKVGLIWPRSGLDARHDVTTGAGVIDHPRSPVYDVYALATAGAGRRKPVNSVRRISAILQALFLCLQSLYGGRCGAVARLAGVLTDRYFLPPHLSATIAVGKRSGGFRFCN